MQLKIIYYRNSNMIKTTIIGDLFSILKQAQQKTGLSEHYCNAMLERIQLRHQIRTFEEYFKINGLQNILQNEKSLL